MSKSRSLGARAKIFTRLIFFHHRGEEDYGLPPSRLEMRKREQETMPSHSLPERRTFRRSMRGVGRDLREDFESIRA